MKKKIRNTLNEKKKDKRRDICRILRLCVKYGFSSLHIFICMTHILKKNFDDTLCSEETKGLHTFHQSERIHNFTHNHIIAEKKVTPNSSSTEQ